MNNEPNPISRIEAMNLWDFFQECRVAGFTREEAFAMTLAIIANGARKD